MTVVNHLVPVSGMCSLSLRLARKSSFAKLSDGQIKFGTDGWRAVIAEDFTFANVERVAQATADYWSANPVAGTGKKVIVGYDRRFLSDKFARMRR